MILLSTVSLVVGALLGQRFRVWVLMPATAIVLATAIGAGVNQAYTAWTIVLMAAAAAASMQIGYLVGLAIHHLLAASLSSRSSSVTASAAPTPASHSAQNREGLRPH